MVGAQEFQQERRRKMPGIQEEIELHDPSQQADPHFKRTPGKAFVGGTGIKGSAAHGAVLADAERLIGIFLDPVAEFVNIFPGIFLFPGRRIYPAQRSPPPLAVQLHAHLDVLYRPVFPIDVFAVIPDGIFEHMKSMPQGVVGPEPVLGRGFLRILAGHIYPLTGTIVFQKGFGRLIPLLLPAMGLDLLQARTVQIQQVKNFLRVARRSFGDKTKDKAEKTDNTLPEHTPQRSTMLVQSSVTIRGLASGSRKWKRTLERQTLLACRM